MITDMCAGARPERRIDWRMAAALLAHGHTNADVAKRVGCRPATVARKRRRDPEFRSWIEVATGAPAKAISPAETMSAVKAPSPARPLRDRITDLRQAVHEAIEAEVRNGNVRVILWLADRLDLVQPPTERTPQEELRTILGELGPNELREFEGLKDDRN